MDFVTGDIVGSNDNGKKKNEECGSMTEWSMNSFLFLKGAEEEDYIQPVEDGYVHHVYTLFTSHPVYNPTVMTWKKKKTKKFTTTTTLSRCQKVVCSNQVPSCERKQTDLLLLHSPWHTIWVGFFSFPSD
jgi:hypothetical protein